MQNPSSYKRFFIAFWSRCLYRFNDIVGHLSKHFVVAASGEGRRHVLIDSSWTPSHVASYLPQVHRIIQKLAAAINKQPGGEGPDEADLWKSLKLELSYLVASITSATSWLQGGLLGLDRSLSNC